MTTQHVSLMMYNNVLKCRHLYHKNKCMNCEKNHLSVKNFFFNSCPEKNFTKHAEEVLAVTIELLNYYLQHYTKE